MLFVSATKDWQTVVKAQSRLVLAACSALALGACAPDLSKVTGDYAKAVDRGKTALGDVVKANANARKTLDYQTIALNRSFLKLTPECQDLFDLTAWSGGKPVVGAGAPDEEERKKDLKERRKRITRAAKDCAVVTGAPSGTLVTAESTLPGAKLRDPLYLCGIDLSRLGSPENEKQVANADVSTPGPRGGGPARIPPLPPSVAAQTEVMPALAA